MRRQIGAVTGVLQTGAADLATATAYPNSNGCFRAANSSKSRWGLGRQLMDWPVLPVLTPKRPSELHEAAIQISESGVGASHGSKSALHHEALPLSWRIHSLSLHRGLGSASADEIYYAPLWRAQSTRREEARSSSGFQRKGCVTE
jgi:hypothetical protein